MLQLVEVLVKDRIVETVDELAEILDVLGQRSYAVGVDLFNFRRKGERLS